MHELGTLLDLRETILARRKQKVQLARYGRCPPEAWRGRPAHEISWTIAALDEAIGQEGQGSAIHDMD